MLQKNIPPFRIGSPFWVTMKTFFHLHQNRIFKNRCHVLPISTIFHRFDLGIKRRQQPNESSVGPDSFVSIQNSSVTVQTKGKSSILMVDTILEPKRKGIEKQTISIKILKRFSLLSILKIIILWHLTPLMDYSERLKPWQKIHKIQLTEIKIIAF